MTSLKNFNIYFKINVEFDEEEPPSLYLYDSSTKHGLNRIN